MTTTHTRRLALSTAILAACAAGGALAEDPDGLAQCSTISNITERVACYDKLAARAAASKAKPSSPAAAPAAAPVSAAPATATRAPAGVGAGASSENDFGLSKVQERANGAASSSPAEKQSITARVTGFRKGPSGRPRVLLNNGQSWEYEEDGDNLLAIGDSVTIRRASLGSFLLETPAKLNHRVRRIR
jgi:hypothetical protein